MTLGEIKKKYWLDNVKAVEDTRTMATSHKVKSIFLSLFLFLAIFFLTRRFVGTSLHIPVVCMQLWDIQERRFRMAT